MDDSNAVGNMFILDNAHMADCSEDNEKFKVVASQDVNATKNLP